MGDLWGEDRQKRSVFTPWKNEYELYNLKKFKFKPKLNIHLGNNNISSSDTHVFLDWGIILGGRVINMKITKH